MNIPKTFSLWLLIAWVGLALVDMWFEVVTTATFIKITITVALIMIVGLGISIARRAENDADK